MPNQAFSIGALRTHEHICIPFPLQEQAERRGIFMKIRKTGTEERGVYKYPISVADGKGGYRTDYITIRPGESDLTEAWITTMHSLDDSEVYYNCKNGHPPLTKEEKAAKEEWEKEHPGEKYPTNWNLSLDYLAAEDCNSQDKSKMLETAHYSLQEEVSPKVERLRNVVETLTPQQQELYQMVVIQSMTLTEAAKVLGTSIPNIHKRMNRIYDQIKKNF